MNVLASGWLGLAFARLAAAAVPVDGSHGVGVRQRKAASVRTPAPRRRRPGQIVFVRGLT